MCVGLHQNSEREGGAGRREGATAAIHGETTKQSATEASTSNPHTSTSSAVVGSSESANSTSLEKRLRMRPRGLASKKRMGARSSLCRAAS